MSEKCCKGYFWRIAAKTHLRQRQYILYRYFGAHALHTELTNQYLLPHFTQAHMTYCYCMCNRLPAHTLKSKLNCKQKHWPLDPWLVLIRVWFICIWDALTQCISVWYGNSSNQDCKALQRVVRLAERISGSTLPSLQVIYLKRCKSRAAKIIKDSTHHGNHLFRLLPSGKRFRSMMAKTERLRRSFFPQAIRLLNTNSV